MLDWLPPHKGELSIAHNEHKSSYESVEHFATWMAPRDDEWAAPDERQRAIDTDSIWVLQWYPETPVGFHRVAASSLDAIRDYFTADSRRDPAESEQ